MGFHRSLPGVGWISIVPDASNPDPICLVTVSGMTVDVNETDADLRGDGPDIIDSFVSEREVTGQITLSDFSTSLIAAVTSGVAVTPGSKIGAQHAATIPTTPFQITVTQGATFADDLGVINLTDGKPMVRDATASATNVYSVNTTTGVYTFNTADAADSVLIMYRYTAATTDTTAKIAKATSSTAAKFALHCYASKAGKTWGMVVPAARLPGISAAFKRDGWSDITIKWKAVLSATDELFYMYAGG